MLDIPQNFEDMTPQWLSDALSQSNSLGTVRVVSRKIESIGEGHGFAGILARLHLTYDERLDSGPASVIAKIPTTNPLNRGTVELIQGYEREVYFFQELAERCELRTPCCYHASMDVDPNLAIRDRARRLIERLPVFLISWLIPLGLSIARRSRRCYLILIEDLDPAENGNQVAGCGADEARPILAALAALHASFWEDPRLSDHPWLPALNWTPRGMLASYRKSKASFWRDFGELVPPHFEGAIGWFEQNLTVIMKRLSDSPATLVHGDYRLDNLFFSGDDIYAIDWQMIQRGRAAHDLAYFVVGSISSEVSPSEEAALVSDYHSRLVTLGVRDYPLTTLRKDFELSKLLFAFGWVASHHLLEIGGDRGEALMDAYQNRLIHRVPEGPYEQLLE